MPSIKNYLLLFSVIFFTFCNNPKSENKVKSTSVNTDRIVTYASGFDIDEYETYTLVTIHTPWPDSKKKFKYALIQEGVSLDNPKEFDAVITVPVNQIAVTSTTHIPSLEMLDETDALVGFPNLNFISSKEARQRISEGKVVDLGQNENLNTEIIIELSPEVLVGFAMDGINPTFSVIEKTGIPVLYNGDWTETTPLGKAEWIKFFGVLFDKKEKADSIFSAIEKEYLWAKDLALTAKTKPTVISGAMFKDVWYTPQGNSWGAQFIDDAQGDYLWKDSKGTGSLSLNIEAVLEKGHDADIWIGPAQYNSLEALEKGSAAYTQFKAFQMGEVYTYNMKKGETGGSIYFELAPNRPDLVLKDHIKILHPELLPEYELFFFDKLQ